MPIAENKTVKPTTVLTFLGFEINTELMLVRIPETKLRKLQGQLENFLNLKKVRLNVLESMVGLMAFCSGAIPSARAFLRRLYDLIATVKNKKPFYFIRVALEIKMDALVWLEFLQNFNGDCYIPEKFWVSSDRLELFTDASGNSELGCGAFLAGSWIQFRWPQEWAQNEILKDITFLELVPILLALYTWAVQFRNMKILSRTDNQALVSVINNRTSRSKRVMHLIRPLVLFTLCNNTQFKAKHIEGSKNIISDALSRFQMDRFRLAAPNAAQDPTQISPKILDIIWNLT